MADAERSEAIRSELLPAVRAVLAPYQVRPEARLDHVSLLCRLGTDVCGDLDDDSAADLFAFRTRLAFTALAARQFFGGMHYCNSDNFRLVAQGFTRENAGGALILNRRRDGSVRSMVSASVLRERRPYHVSSDAFMPRDLDLPLLEALETAGADSRPWWPQLQEAMALFVGANTDSPEVTAHGELVDLVSAFNRLADTWKEEETVTWFLTTLPVPPVTHLDLGGSKLALPRLKLALEKRLSVRAAWLADAYRLRSQHAHGRVNEPPYPAIWTAREHLLLGAVALPLAVKAILARDGLYTWTSSDTLLNEAFDVLATLEPFASAAPGADPDETPESYPWRAVLTQISFRHFLDRSGLDT